MNPLFEDAGCIKYHVFAGKGAQLGPDLTEVAKRFQNLKLLEQIINPSAEIHKDFQTHVFLTQEGQVVSGLITKEEPDAFHVLPNPLKPMEVIVVKKSQIEERKISPISTMPNELLSTFKQREILDLLLFIQSEQK